MFGYIQPYIPYLYFKDGVLYKALYCGLCKSIGGCCGQRARFSLSFDMTFFSALLHNIKNRDVKIENRHCVLHPIVRRPIAEDDEITQTIACLNVALAYYKLSDDVEDEHKGTLARAFFRKGFCRAREKHPEAVRIVQERTAQLRALEKENCDSPDVAADPFASMIAELSDYCLGEYATEHTRTLCYGIGKWVYLSDALDDYDKDLKKKNYNPFLAAYPAPSRKEMLETHRENVDILFAAIFSQNADSLKNIRFYYNHDLTDNIILRGMPAATRRILCGCKDKMNLGKMRIS